MKRKATMTGINRDEPTLLPGEGGNAEQQDDRAGEPFMLPT